MDFTSFQPFSWWALLRGAPIYAFREFYAAKDQLLRYDDRKGYLNYGLWEEGPETVNPSARLVERMVQGLELGPDDALLDVGAGLGQPDADVAQRTSVGSILGINREPRQVELANALSSRLGLQDRVAHRVLDAHALDTLGERFTAAMSVEALAEMPDLDRVLSGLSSVLRPGSPLVFCDIAARPRKGASWSSWTTRMAAAVARTLFGVTWRTVEQLQTALRRAGFEQIEVESVGDRVFPLIWAHARRQVRSLTGERVLVAALLAAANLGALCRLHAWGEIDYVIVRARKACRLPPQAGGFRREGGA